MPEDSTAPPLNIVARMDRPVLADVDKMMLTELDTGLRTLMPFLSPGDLAQVQARFGEWLGKAQHPALVSNEFIEFAVRKAFPALPVAEARRRFARLSVAQYQKSILGRVMFAPLRLMGMDRILRQAPKQFAAASNYGTRWVAEVGPHHWRFDCEDEIMPPEMVMGNLDAVSEFAGVRDLQVTVTLIAPKHYSFDIQWGGPTPAGPGAG